MSRKLPTEFFGVNKFLLIYYEQRHTVHYLNANLERSSVTPDIAVCAVEGNTWTG